MRRGSVAFVTANTFEFDSRHRRAADALAVDGWDVTVVAYPAAHLAADETLPSGVSVRRPEVDRRIVAALPGGLGGAVASAVGVPRDAERLPPSRRDPRAPLRRGLEILAYRRRVGPWTEAVLAAAPKADVFVAKALVALPVVAEAARRRHGRYVYDVADLHVESGRLARLPRPLKAWVRRREAGWVRGAAALLAVTPAMADEVARRFGVSPPAVVMNAREPWRPSATIERSPALAEAAGVAPDREIVLYQGAFRPDQGLELLFDTLAEPVVASRPVTAVFLGFGPLEARLRAAAVSYPERVAVLAAVPSDELLRWTAGADVAFIGAPPVTRNQALTTPNKLFEAVMAGVPVVVATGTYTAELVREHDLGRVVDPWTPRALGLAIAGLLDEAADARAGRRERIRAVALGQLNWDVERERLLAALRPLATPPHVALLLNNPFVADSRSWKIGRSLAAAGYRVTVVAREEEGLPAREVRDGFTVVRVPQPRPFAWLPTPALPVPGTARRGPTGVIADAVGRGAQALRYLVLARQWAVRIGREVGAADLWQSEGLITLPVALRLRDQLGGRVVYDSRDVHVESGRFALLPAPWRELLRRRERGWVARSDALVTVSEPYAAMLEATLGVRPDAIVMNCPVRWDPSGPRPRLLHETLGLEPDTRVVLYLGQVAAGRGVETLVEAIGLVDRAVLVVAGTGSTYAAVRAEAERGPNRDRVHFLPPVPAGEIPAVVASADVAAMPIQPTSPNNRMSTPTKLFDAIGAGTPVVASNLPAIAPIVEASGCGVLCDPTDPTDIARAIREILDAPPERRAAYREACLVAARGEWSWERQAERLLELYGRLV